MEIIPAIDIISGKCVRLTKGNYRLKKVYSGNPLKIAQHFEKTGFKKLHLIDLEGAKEGKIKNWRTIEKIAKNTKLLIEFGGGIRSERDIKKLLGLGIDKVILGSLVLKEPNNPRTRAKLGAGLVQNRSEASGSGFKKIVKKFKEKITAAVDILGKNIYYRGWQEKTKIDIDSFLKDLIKRGAKAIICTDIARDGTLRGPNFSLYKKLVSKFPNLEIIASGGIRNTQDLKKLSKIGVAGVIIGKAIYENKIKLFDLKSFL